MRRRRRIGVGEQERGAAGDRRRRLGRRREAERRLERLDAAADGVRQDAVDLRERAVHAVGREPEPPGRDEPEHDRRRLVVGEHERRQPEAGPEAVAAADAALALDRDAELLQRRDVAPDRPPVDPELVGDLATRHERTRLQELEQLEEARRRRGHDAKSSTR